MAPIRSVKPPPTPRPSFRHSNHYSNRRLNRYPDRHLHGHERRIPTSLENFWIAYSLTRNDDEKDVAEQSRQFWAEYSLTRNDEDEDFEEQRRRFSIRGEQASLLCPPRLSPQCTTLQTQRGLSMAQRARTAYKRFAPAVSTTARVAGGGIAKTASGTKTHGVSAARFCRKHWIVTLIMVVPLTISLIRANYLAALRRDSVPSQPLTKYHAFPTWMHTDPLQVLGFPSAVSPFFFSSPSKDNITYNYKKFRSAWWPAKWRQHNFTDYRTAELAFMRGEAAKDIFDNWYKNPTCTDYVSLLHGRHLRYPKFAYDDGLPSFPNPCHCTYPAYISKQLKMALIPIFWQRSVPQTEENLQFYCPCLKSDAEASWSTFDDSKQPPFLDRFDLKLAWTSYDYRVIRWKLHGRAKPWLHWAFPEAWVLRLFSSMAKTDVDLCVEKYEPACQNVPEWAVPGNFQMRLWGCKAVQQRREPKSIKAGIHPD